MRLAVIGWGSLIWDPGELKLQGRWRKDGPLLPVEFCRLSGGHRLTLALLSGAELQPTCWALSALPNLELALKNLREREKTFPEHIHHLTRNGETVKNTLPEVVQRIGSWLNSHPELDAALWTGLSCNWEVRRKKPFSPADAVEYLKELCQASVSAAAEEYVRKAPKAIQTETRRLIELELGWTATELPAELFE